MDIKQIRYFQAIAQYGSISEAARHLFIVQPALSRQIKELERQLGARLFIRRQKGIELTKAGEQLLQDSSTILQALNLAITNVKRASGIKETLHIGIAPTYTWNPIVVGIIRDFCKCYPDINLSLEPTLAVGQSERLTNGTLDAGFMAWRLKADTTKAGIFLDKCRLLIASNFENSIFKNNKELKSLEREKCLFFPREMSPEFYDFLFAECRKANFRPHIVTCATDFNACLGMVLSGLGYTFISSISRYNCPVGIRLDEHPSLSGQYDFEFVYRKTIRKEALQLLVDFVKKRQNPRNRSDIQSPSERYNR
ncbi:LysR family transcriptional regulator [uncultured Bartonella sp.]|uniref:LysR family transcriptional regulator n=1 Tax=uncultured Bartonella sp. TaxID=104108 RepID=UPI0025DAF5F7|nr:LysR family transcriptional regulator [uncultured Bartonella sp.]